MQAAVNQATTHPDTHLDAHRPIIKQAKQPWRRLVCSLFIGLISCLPIGLAPVLAQQSSPEITVQNQVDDTAQTLATLQSFIELGRDQQQGIAQQQKALKAESSPSEQELLKQQLEKLHEEQRSTENNFKEIAAGVDISILQANEEQAFNLQKEVLALLKPAVEEIREMTAHVRQKTAQKEKITYFGERLPVVESVITNTQQLLAASKAASKADKKAAKKNKTLIKTLQQSLDDWQKQQAFMQSELQAAKVQLDKLLASESSIAESSQAYLKTFFKQRGLYLFQALMAVLLVMLLSRFSYAAMKKVLPGFRAKHRSFQYRLLELAHRFFSILLIIIGPMLVFYLVEDWVLFSLGLLLLFGLLWSLVSALPFIWRQVHLFLNIGSVREGERIDYNGLPWQVERINLYCDITNPSAKMSMRIPIAEMVELKSRPFSSSEPWFPCKQGDWVILNDGVRGKVTGISPELVQLVMRGGSNVTYPTAEFLAQTPHNLATNFRIKEIFGISYGLQADSTDKIPAILHQAIMAGAANDGYAEYLLNLRVEFAHANNSSLDIAIIADFKGEVGDLYNRLRRAIQRWSVDACTENNWEIPFPQMTLHGALKKTP